jgi:anaerobic selenocysteine-containing dehydrogenase
VFKKLTETKAASSKTYEFKVGYCKNNCMLYCGRVAVVKDGRVTEIRGQKDHPISRGKLCAKGLAAISDTYSPHRVLHPMKRVNGKWQRMTWDEALDEAAAKLREIRSEWNGKPLHDMTVEEQRRLARYATPRNSCGEQEFLNYMRFGRAFISSPHYSGCVACNGNWWRSRLAVTGEAHPLNTIDTVLDSKLIIDFGYNVAETAVVAFQWIRKAMEKGTEFIYIDPRYTQTASKASEYIPIRPGTDGAAVLGIMYVLVEKDWVYPHLKLYVDESEYRDFLEKVVKRYPPDKVEEITWIPAAKIRELATKIHEAGRRVALISGSRTSTQTNGFDTGRISTILNLMTGSYGVSGGGDYNPKPGVVPLMYIPFAAAAPYMYPAYMYPDDPHHWGKSWVPETAWPEIMHQIKAYVGLGGNPILRAAGDQRRVYEYLRENGLVVIGTTEWNEMCDYAHYILPMATDLESSGSTILCSTNRIVQWKDAAIPPLGESKQDFWIMSELGHRIFGNETMYRECPDCEMTARSILDKGGSLDDVWDELIGQHLDEINTRLKNGEKLDQIASDLAKRISHNTNDHKYVIRNIELRYRLELKQWGERVGFDLDNHGLLWPYNIFKQGPEAMYHYWWKLMMVLWPVPPNSPAAKDPERCHPFSGLRLDIVKKKGPIFWPAPLCLMEKDPNYRGEKVFFEKCPGCWKTSMELGKPSIPMLWTPEERWSDKTKSFYPWPAGKAYVDLRGETWHGAGLPEWQEPAERPHNIGEAIDWNEDYPLIMTTGKLPHLMSTSSQNVNELLVEVDDLPRVEIHPTTAQHLGVMDGEFIRISTPRSETRGSLTMKARITERIHPKVVFVPTHTGPKAFKEDFRNDGVMLLTTNVEDPCTRMVGYSTNICRIETIRG